MATVVGILHGRASWQADGGSNTISADSALLVPAGTTIAWSSRQGCSAAWFQLAGRAAEVFSLARAQVRTGISGGQLGSIRWEAESISSASDHVKALAAIALGWSVVEATQTATAAGPDADRLLELWRNALGQPDYKREMSSWLCDVLGYKLSTLTRHFRQRFGCSPLVYRRRMAQSSGPLPERQSRGAAR